MINTSEAPQQWALLIGIDKYPNLSKFAQLDGCVNDARLIASILEDHFGFPEDHLTLLLDEAATRDGILAAMHDLAEQVGQDDVVVMGYSGHGSQMTDRHGDEPSGLDETIVPHDAARKPRHNRDIVDDEIYDWLLRVNEKTPYVTLIFDCCHSGTLARDAFGEHARGIEPDLRPVEELPPVPVEGIASRTGSSALGPSGWLPLGRRYVLIAGCRDDERSYEYTDPESGTHHGALTFFLSRELVKAPPNTTYRDLFERAVVAVDAHSPRQHPQLEGARDRVLFGMRDIEPMRFVAVTRRQHDTVHLAAGAAHGLTAGSQWAVYPPGTKHVDETTNRLGRVAIAEVRVTSAVAAILEEQHDGAIAEGTRAVEEAHAPGAVRLRVAIRTPEGVEGDRALLAAEIETSSLLRLVGEGEPAEACASLLLPRQAASEDDPVPQVGRIREPVWAVVGTDGRLLMPTHRVRLDETVEVVRDNLEKVARFRHGLALTNPDPSSRLQGKIDLVLGRLRRNGAWTEAEPDAASGEVVYEEGDYVAFRVTNNHTEAVYVNVLDFAPGWIIGLMHPMGAANEPLPAGVTLEVGVRRGNQFRFGLPQNFPYETDPAERLVVQGTESFKVFATSHPADFSPLMQTGVRKIDPSTMQGGATPLGRLLTMALTGDGSRSARPVKTEPVEDWTTVTRSFVLRRR